METGKILITGATGNVGKEVAKRLAGAGEHVVAGVRNIQRAQAILGSSVNCVTLDFANKETYAEALEGVSTLFLVRPPQIADVKTYVFPFIDLAAKTGVKKIVFLSLLGAEKNVVIPHYKIEKHLKSSGIPYTFLRASFFMQNLSTTHHHEIKERNEILVPAGKGKTSFIDVRDIAEAGVVALTQPGHEYRAYDLTGKEAFDYFQVADFLTRTLGRPISYSDPSPLKFYQVMKKKGETLGFILVMIAIYTTARLGMAARVSADLENILGREPTSLERFVTEYQECWA